jgi:hypothetical protein
LVLFGAIACGGSGDSGAREPDSAPKAEVLAVRGDGGDDAPADAGTGDAAPAWTQFARRDDVPLCLFTRYEDWGHAQFLGQAKQKVALKAGRPLYFGTYAPGCADPECVRRVTLQCWADVEGKTITVSTRFSGERQLAHPCANNCQPDTAACETPPLKAGTYTLIHGTQQRTLRVPGVADPACLPESQ